MKDLYVSNKAKYLVTLWKEKNTIQTLSNATFCFYLTTTYLNSVLLLQSSLKAALTSLQTWYLLSLILNVAALSDREIESPKKTLNNFKEAKTFFPNFTLCQRVVVLYFTLYEHCFLVQSKLSIYSCNN